MSRSTESRRRQRTRSSPRARLGAPSSQRASTRAGDKTCREWRGSRCSRVPAERGESRDPEATRRGITESKLSFGRFRWVPGLVPLGFAPLYSPATRGRAGGERPVFFLLFAG